MQWFVRLFIVGLIGLVVSACESPSTLTREPIGDAFTPDLVQVDTVPDDTFGAALLAAQNLCSRRLACLGEPAFAERYLSEGYCVTTETELALQQLFAADTGWTLAKRQLCSGALAGVSCAVILGRPDQLPEVCRPTGNRKTGASCWGGAQCQSGYCAAATSACGTCELPPTGVAGCGIPGCLALPDWKQSTVLPCDEPVAPPDCSTATALGLGASCTATDAAGLAGNGAQPGCGALGYCSGLLARWNPPAGDNAVCTAWDGAGEACSGGPWRSKKTEPERWLDTCAAGLFCQDGKCQPPVALSCY